MKTLGDSIRDGVKWLFMGNASSQFLQFAFGIVLARLLVPADFGMVITLQVFTGFVGVVASGGMGQSLIRAKEATSRDFNAVFTLQLAIGVLIYVAFFTTAPLIAHYLDNELYRDLLRVSALSFILRPFSIVRGAWLSREMEFRRRAQIGIVLTILTGVASLVMAAAGMGVWSLILSGVLGAVAGNILLAYVTPLRVSLLFSRDVVRKHGGYGFKITASEVLKHLKEQGLNLMMSMLAGPAFLGLFNKAESLARLPNRLITPPTSEVVFRGMSKVQDDLDQTKYMFHRMITLLMVYISPSLIGLWWVADPFVVLVYGEKWRAAVEPLEIIVLVGFLRIIWIPCGLVLATQNRLTQALIGEFVGLLVAIPAYYFGLRWGLPGVAWALVCCGVFNTAYAYVLVRQLIPVRIADLGRAIAPVLLLDLILLAVLATAQELLVTLASPSPLLYLIVMVAAGGLAYVMAFLFIPIRALQAESSRWRGQIRKMGRRITAHFRQ